MNDSDFDPVIELRASWCNILEEIMECPVCFEIPKDSIYQCIKGHDVCQLCKKLLHECPVCRGPLSETRNWTLEKIISKFSEIKLSLMEPENDINKIVKQNVGVQTEVESGPVLRRSTRNLAARAEKRAADKKK